MCLLIWTVFSGERCGPWASFLPYVINKIPVQTNENKIFDVYLIDWIVFYAVTAIFQQNNGGFDVCKF